AMRLELRIRVLHEVDNEVSNLIEKRSFESQRVMALVDRSSHDLAQHVIATFVAGQNSISNREGSRACVISYHTHRKPFLRFWFVVAIGEFSGEFDDRTNQVRIVV